MAHSHNQASRNTRRGAALLFTLITLAAVAVIAAGIGSLAVAHLNRSVVDQSSAKSLALAECALNFQVQKIDANIGNPQTAFDRTTYNIGYATYGTPSSPYPVGIVTPMKELLGLAAGDSCVSWLDAAPDIAGGLPVRVYGSASVGGVTRTVRCSASTGGVFSRWALFGMQSVALGAASVTSDGPVGTNGALTATGAVALTRQGLNGGEASSTVSTPPPVNCRYPVTFPTAAQVADQEALYCRAFTGKPAPPYQSTIPTSSGINDFRLRNDNASALCQDSGGMSLPFPANGQIPGGATLALVGKAWGANYFLTGFDCGGAYGAVAVDTTNGPVNLWIVSSGTDTLQGSITVTGDSTRFHFYESNAVGSVVLTDGGSAPVTLPMMLYVYDKPGSVPVGAVHAIGRVTLQGAVVCGRFQCDSGSLTVHFLASPRVTPGEGALAYRPGTDWQEVSPPYGY